MQIQTEISIYEPEWKLNAICEKEITNPGVCNMCGLCFQCIWPKLQIERLSTILDGLNITVCIAV